VKVSSPEYLLLAAVVMVVLSSENRYIT